MAMLLDVRGLSCPIPLLKIRDAMASTEAVEALIDDPAARENILKYGKSQGYRVTETVVGKYEVKLLLERT